MNPRVVAQNAILASYEVASPADLDFDFGLG
jgi:hypothetical protein